MNKVGPASEPEFAAVRPLAEVKDPLQARLEDLIKVPESKGAVMKIRDIEVFQISWSSDDKPAQRSALVRVQCDDGLFGIGEASPMQGGLASLGIVRHNLAPALLGRDPLDHAVLLDTLLHTFAKLGPEGALTGALAALDIALWDVKGKLFDQPIYKLLGGAWRSALPFYASIGGNGERSVDEVLRVVEARLKDKPAAVKIRFDNDRTKPDLDIPGDIAKARAVRRLVGDSFPLAFDANNGYSVGGAIRVGRVLEELGYWWFEEPVQHYHVKAMVRSRNGSISQCRPVSRPIRSRGSPI
jgi:L-alanine-DL-glutamate epimerase-like enolase superfamily enzyme